MVMGDCCAQAYDQHLNMILGEVEETLTTVEIDDETYEEIIKVRAPCARRMASHMSSAESKSKQLSWLTGSGSRVTWSAACTC